MHYQSQACDSTDYCNMDLLAAEVDRVVFTPYPTQLKVGDTAVNAFATAQY
jgi:hypothetical protein